MGAYDTPCDQRAPAAAAVAYESSGSDDEWIALTSGSLAWSVDDGVWVGSARCPRCCHDLSVLLPRVFGLDGTIELPIICNCTEPHATRPEKDQGCGRYGVVYLKDIPEPAL